MPINILMPALSPTMEKGNLAKWLKKEGDAVKTGDVIAEIETDKATMEFEAIDDGVMAKIVVPEGTEDVPVHQLIAVMAQEGEDPKAAAAAAAPAGKGAPAAKAPSGGSLTPPSPQAQRKLPASGPHHRSVVRKARRTRGKIFTSAAAPRAPSPQRGEGGGEGARPDGHGANRVFSSPLARRLAKEAGIDLGRIAGSGPHGRVIARDVAAAKEGKGLQGPAAAARTRCRSAPARRRRRRSRRRRRTRKSARCLRPARTRWCRTTISAGSSRSGSRWPSRRSRIST